MVDKKSKTKPNLVEEAITTNISEKRKMDTVNKTEKSQASNKTVDTHKIKNTDTVKSFDKKRSTQITDAVNTVYKSRSIQGTYFFYISTRIEKPTEIDIVKDNTDPSNLSLPGDDLAGITPYILCIPRNNKIKTTTYTSIRRNIYIQE